jgi:hypothetical protein
MALARRVGMVDELVLELPSAFFCLFSASAEA